MHLLSKHARSAPMIVLRNTGGCADVMAEAVLAKRQGSQTPIKYDTNYPKQAGTPTLTLDSSVNPVVVKFWTYNTGVTVFAQYLGQYT